MDFDLLTPPMSSLRTYRLLVTRHEPIRHRTLQISSDLVRFSFITLNLPSDVSRCLTFTQVSTKTLPLYSFPKMAIVSFPDVQYISILVVRLLLMSSLLINVDEPTYSFWISSN